MKISSITNQNFLYKNSSIKQKSISFAANINSSKLNKVSDVFIKSKDNFNIEKNIENLYSKLIEQVQIYQPADIVNKAVKISKISGKSLEDAFVTLDILTKFSTLKSLKNIENIFKENNINSFSNLKQLYEPGITKVPPNLNQVLSYLFIRNISDFHAETSDTKSQCAVLLDSVLLGVIEKLSDEKKDKFYNYVSKKNIQFIYLKDFEFSYNFLMQHLDLEKLSISILKNTKASNQEELKEQIHNILNQENLEKIEELKLPTKILDCKSIFSKNNPLNIAENLNPIIHNKNEFKETILKVILNFDKSEQLVGGKYIVDFLEKMFFPVTFKKQNEMLIQLNEKIDKFMKDEKRDPEKVYYLIPNEFKSFILPNYLLQQIKKTKNNSYIYPNHSIWDTKTFKLNKLPDESTVVILDDCSVTGLSLAKECFDYKNSAYFTLPQNLSIIFAPIFSTECGMQNITDSIKRYGRAYNDKFFTAQIIPTWKKQDPILDEKFLNLERSYQYLTSIVFPYMGPDTNCEQLVPLYEKFLYSPDAQKIPTDNLDFDYGYI